MIIKDIQHIKNGETRTDGRYPLRIGCTVSFCEEPTIGWCMWLMYHNDRDGNLKDGYLRTSYVENIFRDQNDLIVETMNSRYIFQE